jgi:hypothetical protein
MRARRLDGVMVSPAMIGGRGSIGVFAGAFVLVAAASAAAADGPGETGAQAPPAEHGVNDDDAPRWDWKAARAEARRQGRRHVGFMLPMTIGPGYFWSEYGSSTSITRSSRRSGDLPLESDGQGVSFGLDLGLA